MNGIIVFLTVIAAVIAACVAILYKLGVKFDRYTKDAYNLSNGKTKTVTRCVSFYFGKRH